MEEGFGTGAPWPPTKKPLDSCWCVLQGSSNTIYDKYSKAQNAENKCSVRYSCIQFIQITVKGFQPSKRSKIHLCSGHFDRPVWSITSGDVPKGTQVGSPYTEGECSVMQNKLLLLHFHQNGWWFFRLSVPYPGLQSQPPRWCSPAPPLH